MPSWKVSGTLPLCLALRRGWGSRHKFVQLQGHVNGPAGKELWAKIRKEPVSFPPTMARMDTRAVDQECSEQESWEMTQWEALDQRASKVEH